jgi:hypothetical protein
MMDIEVTRILEQLGHRQGPKETHTCTLYYGRERYLLE